MSGEIMLMVDLKMVSIILIFCWAIYSEAAADPGQYIDLQIEKFVTTDYSAPSQRPSGAAPPGCQRWGPIRPSNT
jgi:hypothetical protein